MTTYLGKSCLFGLPRVSFVHCCQFVVFSYFPFGFEGRMWDLIVSVPDHCLSFYCGYHTSRISPSRRSSHDRHPDLNLQQDLEDRRMADHKDSIPSYHTPKDRQLAAVPELQNN